MRVWIIAAALAFAGQAHAQTTHCEPSIVGMPSAGVDCTTSGEGGGQAMPAYSWRDVPPKPCIAIDRLAAPLTYCAAREVAAKRKAVGDLIAAGRCDDALKAALGTGDLQFAGEVRAFCSSTPK